MHFIGSEPKNDIDIRADEGELTVAIGQKDRIGNVGKDGAMKFVRIPQRTQCARAPTVCC